MPKLTVDGCEVEVPAGATVMQACEMAGRQVPRFCYHERLSIAGNCRMCLVEMEKAPKPIASCAMPAADGMVILTDSDRVRQAREGVMEFILINHPLDCPICDQGGECDLQDQAMVYGRGYSRFSEHKRAVSEKNMGPLIKTAMTRCIHCTRCVRFSEEVAGGDEIGALYRGENMQITTWLERALTSELSGNLIDLCPVGALTSRPYAFTARPWELRRCETIDVMDAEGAAIRVDSFGNQVMRILPRLNEEVNEEWISDKTRFACDGLAKKRLDRPWIRKGRGLVEASWEEAFAAIRDRLEGQGGSAIAGVVGDLADCESAVALQDLLHRLGSDRIECRVDGSALPTKARSDYLFNSGFKSVDDADVVVLIGANPRYDAPLLNLRLRRAVRYHKAQVFLYGSDSDPGYRHERLVCRDLDQLLNGEGPVAQALQDGKKPLVIIGQDALRRSDGQALYARAHAIAGNAGSSLNVLHTASGRVGALDLNCVSSGGMDAIVQDVESGKISCLFNLGVDEVAIPNKAFTVYIGTHGDQGAQGADVILPAAAYTEKSGTWVNSEGRVQRGQRAVFPPGLAREDWAIFRALSEILGPTLPYDNLQQVRERLIEANAVFATVASCPETQPGGENPYADALSQAINTSESAIDPVSFYQTNPIARASDTMGACVQSVEALAQEKAKQHEGVEVHG